MRKSMLVSILAIAAVGVIGAISVPVYAQWGSDPGSGASYGLGQQQLLASLNLTAEQQAQIDQIRAGRRTRIQSILTPAQQADLRDLWIARRQSGSGAGSSRQDRNAIWQELNLTPQQDDQIQAVIRSSWDQMMALLTPAQQQQLQNQLQNRIQTFE